MFSDYDRRRIIEHKKAVCREKIDFHKKNVILQSIITFLCVAGGTYAGQRKSIVVPLILAPMAGTSFSKFAKHESKRQYYKKTLEELERT